MTASTLPSLPPSSWRSIYPVHPCADVYPMMTDTDLDALAADIKANGLRAPAILWMNPADQRLYVLDGRNRLEALARNGIHPSEAGLTIRMFERKDIADPAAFVISVNIRRRHLTKAQQAELIVKTIEAERIDQTTVVRSFSPTPGQKGGSTKDPVLEQAVSEATKHGISPSTVRNARAKLRGKTPAPRKTIGISATPPTSSARPLVTPSPAYEQVDEQLRSLHSQVTAIVDAFATLDAMAPRLTAAERRTVLDRLLKTRARLDASVKHFGGRHRPAPDSQVA